MIPEAGRREKSAGLSRVPVKFSGAPGDMAACMHCRALLASCSLDAKMGLSAYVLIPRP